MTYQLNISNRKDSDKLLVIIILCSLIAFSILIASVEIANLIINPIYELMVIIIPFVFLWILNFDKEFYG